MKEKEYCYKIVLNPEYILYIGKPFGLYHVFCTNEKHTFNYSAYGGYKNIGTASNKLLAIANSYKTNDVSYYYATKQFLDKNGAF